MAKTGQSITQKIIKRHLLSGNMVAGEKISIRIDQTLTQDATGTMAYLQFEALGIPKVKTKLSVSYIDHNTLQTGFENADDHLFLQTIASKYGIKFSRPGNGICHQIHLERFGVPGQTLLGSDSHTPTNGGIGMMAIGAGGLDVALAMAGKPFYMTMPKVALIKLKGKLKDWVSAKDVILEILQKLTVKGGVGKIIEYGGDGVLTLSVPERAVITNMGAELGATTSLFPSDDITRQFLRQEKRVKNWSELAADKDAAYDEIVEINLSKVVPMLAQPHSPDNVCKVTDISGKKIQQVVIGSCTNSSYKDLMTVAQILKGKQVHPDVSLAVSPGSRQVFNMIAKNGALNQLIAAGARVLESSCGPCIGMGQSPSTDAVSLRTFNRNFLGRSGTKSAQVYLVSPELAAVSALKGVIADPRRFGKYPRIPTPRFFSIDDSMVLEPSKNPKKVEVVRGPNIKALPIKKPLSKSLAGKVLLKLSDNITTDHIMPAGAKILPLRSNIPAISEHVFSVVDTTFYKRAKKENGGFIVGGLNYGQGSSREHAALAPMYLGVKAVITKGFARIHMANLVNFGIVPLTFLKESDYKKIDQDDEIYIDLSNLSGSLTLNNKTKKIDIPVVHSLGKRDIEILKAGGALGYAKKV